MSSSFLSLLQISDSFFPTGVFTQSYGLETYVEAGRITSRQELAEFLSAYLYEVVAASDGLAMLLAYRAAKAGDVPEIIELDRIMAAQKLSRESREGSAKVGTQMLKLIARLHPSPVVVCFNELVAAGEAFGHHSIVFGVAGDAIGAGEHELALAFAYNTAAAVVNSAVRLVPLGQNDGQLILRDLHQIAEDTARKSAILTKEDIGSAAVALEIRSMQHERLYSRLFTS